MESSDKCSLCGHFRSYHITDKNGYNYCENCDCHGFEGYPKNTDMLDGNFPV
jgi:hypothetical protein